MTTAKNAEDILFEKRLLLHLPHHDLHQPNSLAFFISQLIWHESSSDALIWICGTLSVSGLCVCVCCPLQCKAGFYMAAINLLTLTERRKEATQEYKNWFPSTLSSLCMLGILASNKAEAEKVWVHMLVLSGGEWSWSVEDTFEVTRFTRWWWAAAGVCDDDEIISSERTTYRPRMEAKINADDLLSYHKIYTFPNSHSTLIFNIPPLRVNSGQTQRWIFLWKPLNNDLRY